MAMFYYYIDFDYAGKETKKGPYNLEELRALNLPVDTKIWSDGWEANKTISECPEVMEFLTLTPPEIPATPEEIPVVEPEAEMIAVYPEMHWIPKLLMYFGILAAIRQFISAFALNDSALAMGIDIAVTIWGAVSIFGMLDKKKWALISYFVYRFFSLIMLIWIYDMGISNGDDFVKDFISLFLIIGIFFISKDGHNVYELLWNNGVFYVKRAKPIEEPTEQPEESSTEVTE